MKTLRVFKLCNTASILPVNCTHKSCCILVQSKFCYFSRLICPWIRIPNPDLMTLLKPDPQHCFEQWFRSNTTVGNFWSLPVKYLNLVKIQSNWQNQFQLILDMFGGFGSKIIISWSGSNKNSGSDGIRIHNTAWMSEEIGGVKARYGTYQ